MLGALRTISLQSLSAAGVTLLGQLTGVEGGQLRFADDLAEHIRLGDEGSAATKRKIDAYIESAGIEAPPAEPDPAETVTVRLPHPPILELDPAEAGLAAVIWCTGLTGDFGWIALPGVLDGSGEPIHDKCISPVPGLCFGGARLRRQPWLRDSPCSRRGSSPPRARHGCPHCPSGIGGGA